MCKKIPYLLFVGLAYAINSYGQVTDPTRPLGFTTPLGFDVSGGNQQVGLELTSILISADRKIAIINGQYLRESQTVKGVGAVVKAIEADAVTLQQNNKTWRLALSKTTVRK